MGLPLAQVYTLLRDTGLPAKPPPPEEQLEIRGQIGDV